MAQKNYSLEELEVDIIQSPCLAQILLIAEEITYGESFSGEVLVEICKGKYNFSESDVLNGLSQLIEKGYVFRKEKSERYFLRKGRFENEKDYLVLLVESE